MREFFCRAIATGVLAAGMAVCSACRSGSQDATALETMQHPNGLAISVEPDFWDVWVVATGFEFRVKGADSSRSPRNAKLLWRAVSQADHAGMNESSTATSRMIDGKQVRFEIRAVSGGSGGEEHYLRAWRECDSQKDRILLLTAGQQSETSPPSFDRELNLIGMARCPN